MGPTEGRATAPIPSFPLTPSRPLSPPRNRRGSLDAAVEGAAEGAREGEGAFCARGPFSHGTLPHTLPLCIELPPLRCSYV